MRKRRIVSKPDQSQDDPITEFAKAIGRYIAEREFERLTRGKNDAENRRALRKVFDRKTEI